MADAVAVGIDFVAALEIGVDQAAAEGGVDARSALVLDDEPHAPVQRRRKSRWIASNEVCLEKVNRKS